MAEKEELMATIQFAPAVAASGGLIRIEGTPSSDVRPLNDPSLFDSLTPKQIKVFKEIMEEGFDIIVYPDGAVQLDR